MKINKIVIGLMFMTLSLSSCSDWFDVSSSTIIKEKDLFKNEQGFKDVFTGVYTLLTTQGLYGKELTYGYNDIRAKYWNVTKSDHVYFKAMSYNYTDSKEVGRIDLFWNRIYKAISNVNAILANIDNNKSIFAPDMHDLYKGEAYALRAMLHFELLRLYGESPVAPNAMESKSIPYYSQFTNIAQPILPMKDVFGKIRTDISLARDLMRDIDPYGPNYDKIVVEKTTATVNGMKRNIKMNYWAATALLARMELYAGNKGAALAAAKELIGEVGDAPKAPLALNTYNSDGYRLFQTELIFSLSIAKLKDVVDQHFGANETTTSSTKGLMMKNADYNKLFTVGGEGDVEYRKTLCMKKVDEANFTLSKYDIQENNNAEGDDNTKVLMPMIRLSELYYIAAEAAGDNTTAFGYLNTIRAGRGLAPLTGTPNLTNEIRKEYMREFIGEGQFFYYFKRLGITSNVGLLGKTMTLQQYVLPLSNNEIGFGKVE